jgi:RNA polymerase sigma-70 factor (ECF subfamily)
VLDYERRWACALVERAFAALRDEYARSNKLELFNVLSPFLTRPVPPGYYEESAVQLRMTEGALKVAMHRLLPRFGELLRREVANTVAGPELVDTELREVLKAWASD